MKKILIISIVVVTAFGFRNSIGKNIGKDISIIPKPQQMVKNAYYFKLNKQTKIIVPNDKDVSDIGQILSDYLSPATGFNFAVEVMNKEKNYNAIQLAIVTTPDTLGREGYILSVGKNGITLKANQPTGLFRGIQTIRQLLPTEIENISSRNSRWNIPSVEIVDKPRFPWRGMLLDCGRHFMEKDFIKRYIDLLAYHKMNTLHWHLTEDQGWRIEIKKYPKLTEVGAWRTQPDGSNYGGYYTQDDVKEIVAYAQSRHINVIPEIELPGHSRAALAAYPQFSCTGGPFEVASIWGVHKDVYCAGNDQTFSFIEDILSEVIDLFPGKYIHIGGDESPKDRWQDCPKCQARIKNEGLTDEHELQSYFIKRIEKFLNSKGRQVIGWDEILEGGLAPGATVQSWRGIEGGIAAAKQGHDVIMSPTSHAYFDYDVSTTDLRQVYTFNPIPKELTLEESKHVLGGECNMWTERAPQELVDSKMFPRMLAMAEVLWSDPNGRDYEKFYDRVETHYERLDYLGVTYGSVARPIFIRPSFDIKTKQIFVNIETGERGLSIRYTTDSNEPTILSKRFKNRITVKETTTLKSAAFKNGRQYGSTVTQKIDHHLGVGSPISLKNIYSSKYSGTGEYGSLDGIRGSTNFRDGTWQGFEYSDFNAVIDLGIEKELNSIEARFLQNNNSWIFMPKAVEFALSTDGKYFDTVYIDHNDISPKTTEAVLKDFKTKMNGRKARYVRVHAKNRGTCPEWHPGAGGKAWLFVDEIVIR